MTGFEDRARQLALTVLRLTDELLISAPLLSESGNCDLIDARAYARDVVAETSDLSEADRQAMALRLERWGTPTLRRNRPDRSG